MLAGRLEEAHVLAERALALARERQERGNQAYVLRLLGAIAARREPSESESAEAHYRQALALAEELGMRPLQAHCHLGLGTLYVQTGRPEPARAALTAAIALYRAMEMTFWLPQAEAALAQVSWRARSETCRFLKERTCNGATASSRSRTYTRARCNRRGEPGHCRTRENSSQAKFGRMGFRRNFQFDQEWRGRHYRTKQVEAYAVQEGVDWLVITVITRYF